MSYANMGQHRSQERPSNMVGNVLCPLIACAMWHFNSTKKAAASVVFCSTWLLSNMECLLMLCKIATTGWKEAGITATVFWDLVATSVFLSPMFHVFVMRHIAQLTCFQPVFYVLYKPGISTHVYKICSPSHEFTFMKGLMNDIAKLVLSNDKIHCQNL